MKILSPIFAEARQKLGGAVAYKWKNYICLRSYVAKNESKSEAQLDQRAKFKLAISLGRTLLGFIREGFKSEAVNSSEFNCFTGQGMPRV